jgi:hypothetical protein
MPSRSHLPESGELFFFCDFVDFDYLDCMCGDNGGACSIMYLGHMSKSKDRAAWMFGTPCELKSSCSRPRQLKRPCVHNARDHLSNFMALQ